MARLRDQAGLFFDALTDQKFSQDASTPIPEPVLSSDSGSGVVWFCSGGCHASAHGTLHPLAGAVQKVGSRHMDPRDTSYGKNKRTRRRAFGLSALMATAAWPGAALAQAATQSLLSKEQFTLFGRAVGTDDALQFALFCTAMAAAIVAAFLMMRERSRIAATNTALRGKVSSLTTRVNQLEAATTGDGQVALIYAGNAGKPLITGKLDQNTGSPAQDAGFLAFGRWFEPASASRLEHAITTLREKAEPFSAIFETQTGMPIEVQGRTTGGNAIVRFANLSAERARNQKLANDYERVSMLCDLHRQLLEVIDHPCWLRGTDGRLTWANKAYLDAIEKETLDGVNARSAELFGSQALQTIEKGLGENRKFSDKLSTVVRGDRVVYHATAVAGSVGSLGLADDMTDEDNVSRELANTVRSHEETLDGLTTAVAMFDEHQRLKFHNQAFRELWDLPLNYLQDEPDMAIFLQHLRSQGKLPEQPEWQRWKNDILSAYRSVEPVEHLWHLPDNRTLRVVANPHPRGGLTWVFENLTDQIDLESRYTTLTRVQSETLDHLSEGVAVFGPDGYLELCNPAFKAFWGLEKVLKDRRVHVSTIRQVWDANEAEHEIWDHFGGVVTGFDDERDREQGRFDLGGQILTWSALPLPNGQTMLTFVDMTGPDQVERALREKNEALERTGQLKNRFIQHVSYELRSPLTNITGFTDLLEMEKTGPLNPVQAGYVGNIRQASDVLMQLTDDIVDLATIDAGMFELEIEPVDVHAAMRHAAETVQERFTTHSIDLLIRAEPTLGTIHADPDRLHRVFVNILKNAANFAPEGSTATFSARRSDDGQSVIIIMRDSGPGMDEDITEQVFERFHTVSGGRLRGAGLGLSIVKSFVLLHEGDVDIRSAPGKGTMVEITLPEMPDAARVAAQ
jgi:signal transduction histidine kinase